MADQKNSYNDRDLSEEAADALPKPQIDIIVDGNKIFKPAMKTFFVDDYGAEGESPGGVVMGEYCTCNTVTTVHTVCTCEHVCSCESVCSCVSYTIPTGPSITPSVPHTGTICTCQAVSCGAPCACVPVS